MVFLASEGMKMRREREEGEGKSGQEETPDNTMTIILSPPPSMQEEKNDVQLNEQRDREKDQKSHVYCSVSCAFRMYIHTVLYTKMSGHCRNLKKKTVFNALSPILCIQLA